MNKCFFIICIFGLFAVSCATMSSAGDSELVITREGSYSQPLQININGKMYVEIKQGETRKIKIPNGHNVINGIRSDQKFGGSLSFDSHYERIEMIVQANASENISFEIRNRVALSQPQNLNPLRNSAISASFNTLNPLIPNDSKIAILNITPVNTDTLFIQEELNLLFVNSQNYTVVDRQTLDTIRDEQRFQMSGEVNDETAVSIGHFIGADVVIVGSISENATQRRLHLRVINVKTAQILAMSSEDI